MVQTAWKARLYGGIPVAHSASEMRSPVAGWLESLFSMSLDLRIWIGTFIKYRYLLKDRCFYLEKESAKNQLKY